MRIILSIVVFAGVVGLADLQGPGHGFAAVLLLALLLALVGSGLSRGAWRAIIAAALLASLVMAAIAVLQMFYMTRARGVFVSANFLGGYAVMLLFLALHYGRRLGLIAAAGNALSLVLAQGRGAFVAAAVALAVLYGRRYPRSTAAGVAALAAGCLYEYLTRGAVEEPRPGLWRLGLQLFVRRPILGWGQNGVLIWPNGWGHYYSIPVEWLVWSGVLGFGAGAWMIYEGLRASRSAPALTALLVAWIVNGLFIFDTAATSVPLFLVLGYLASEQRRETKIAVVVDDLEPRLNGSV